MSVQYDYTYFDSLNFANVVATSGYSLEISPFTFRPRIDNSIYSNDRISWDFGDGTTSTAVTATHYYKLPGRYKVTMYLYDGEGKSYLNSSHLFINVYDYISDSIVLSATNLKFNTSVVARNVFDVYRYNSWQTYSALSANGYTIQLSVSGNNAPFITQEEYDKQKYGHLSKYSQFFQLQYNTRTGLEEFVAADKILTDNVTLFARLTNSEINLCQESDEGAIFVGTSGRATCSFKDDIPTQTNPTAIFAFFNNAHFYDNDNIDIEYLDSQRSVHSTNAQTFYCTTTASPPAGLSITSTGLSSMQINPIQFVNTRIPFVVNIIDEYDAPCKFCFNLKRLCNIGTLSANTIQLSAIDSSTSTVISAAFVNNFEIFTNEDVGIYKGYCSFSVPQTGVRLSVVAAVSSVFGEQTLSAVSNEFSVLRNDNDIAKIGENFDWANTYKSYRFQENLLTKDIFFDDFLGTIVGNVSASTDSIGKRIQSKINNFVDNTQNIDSCNIQALYSHIQLLQAFSKQFERYNFSVPADLARLMDILSIKQSKLWGKQNEFNLSFDSKGYIHSNIYGINKGDELDVLTTILTAGSSAGNIVAYERFSDTYKLINTDILSSANINFIDSENLTYPLSAYNDYWGWGLVLPNNFDPIYFDQYYKFYEYLDNRQEEYLDGIINWSDNNNTLIRTL